MFSFTRYAIAKRCDNAKEFRSIYIDTDVTLVTTTRAKQQKQNWEATELTRMVNETQTFTMCLIQFCGMTRLQLNMSTNTGECIPSEEKG